MESKPNVNAWLDILMSPRAAAVGVLISSVIGVGTYLNRTRVEAAAIDSRLDAVEQTVNSRVETFDDMRRAFPDVQRSTAWTEANLYQLLIHFGIQPVDPIK